jgi:probable phosphoglycerate mutase
MRHGRTAWNKAGRIQGRTDIPLDDETVSELRSLALPDGFSKDALVASPLLRARQTAELVGRVSLTIEDALLEMDWGDWEGQAGADLRRDPNSGYVDIDQWGWEFRPPNGEALRDLRTRVQVWLDTLREDTVAVSHIGVMRVCLAIATQWDFDSAAPFAIKRNRLYIMTRRNGIWRMDASPVRLVERSQ